MEQNMVLISRDMVDHMITMMGRAEYYCAHAISTFSEDYDEEHDDPTRTYPGASGYAGATMRDIIQTIESHLD